MPSNVGLGTETAPDDTARPASAAPTALISYAWDTPEQDHWVEEFATRLRLEGVDAIIDRWALQHGDSLTAFMEREIRERKFVLIICTPNYKAKSDDRRGGVGYEGNIMTAEVYSKLNHRKFIPVLRQAPDSESIPYWLAGRRYVNLSENVPRTRYESEFAELVRALHDEVAGPPPLIPRQRPPNVGTTIEPPGAGDLPPAEPREREIPPLRDPAIVGAATTTSSRQTRAAPSDAGLSGLDRNDPCPCGSGKKFKKCHGGSA